MATFHFFTDIDRLTQQTSEQAFGPFEDAINYPDKDCYRVTSKHTLTEDSFAYAVCKGKILVQQDNTNPLLVNIILKPELQPINSPAVKFFVYRGIKKNSLITSEGIIAIDTCSLTYAINQLYTEVPQKIFGYDLVEIPNYDLLTEEEKAEKTNYPDESIIETIFYESFADFELWTVNEGWSIGEFDKDNAGFEIMLDTLSSNATLELVRNSENIITVTSLTGSETEADTFNHWHKKETILHYIDPTAFYGNFYKEIIKARTSLKEIDNKKIPIFDKYKKDEIYTEILNGTNGNFLNRNNIYLDIRNELNYSMNYFGNYQNNIKISFLDDDNEPENEIDYYRNLWPLLSINHVYEGGAIELLKLAFPKGDNELPLIFVDCGDVNRRLIKKIVKGNSRFEEIEIGEISNYSLNSIELNIHHEDNNLCIAGYNKLIYIKRINPNEYTDSYNSILRSNHYFDHLFMPLKMNIPFNESHNVMLKIYEEKIFCDRSLDFNRIYMIKRGIAKDGGGNIIFFGFNVYDTIISRNSKSNPPITTCYSNNETYFLDYLANKLNFPDLLKNSTVADIPVYKYETTTSFETISDKDAIDSNKDFVMLILSTENYNSIIELTKNEFDSGYDVFIGIKRKIKPIEFNSNGEYYTKQDIVLRGLKIQSNNSINVLEVDTDISIYGYNSKDIY